MGEAQKTKILCGELIAVLEEQIRVYRHLLEIVRKEKEILVAAKLDDLNENNRSKEAHLIKIRALESERLAKANGLFLALNLAGEHPRLLEMARHLDQEDGDKLRNIHSVLELLLRRVQEHNKQNEALVQSALSNITGAMKEIKGTVSEKPTYQKSGASEGHTSSGLLVSREA